MAEKLLQTRIQLKHDTETNWDKATNFKPKDGEVIIYDIDDTHTLPRLKIGDNATVVKDLPFVGTMTAEEKIKLANLPTIIISETEPETDCDLWIDTSVGGGQSVIFTPELKEKLDSIEYGATATSQVEIEMDTVLSDTSTNGVQNKVITAALATKLEADANGKLAFDKLPVGFTSETVLRGDYGKTAYDHAVKKGNAFDLDLYKFSTNDEGHVINAVPVERADLVSLIGEIVTSSTCCLTDMTQNDFTGKTSEDWQALYNEGKHYALVGEESNSWFIVDNLTTDDSEKALSAKQGQILNNKIEQLGTTYLPLAGGTMTGHLTISNNAKIISRSNTMTQTAGDTVSYFEPIEWYDANGKRIGAIGTTNYNTGELATHIQVQREIDGTTYYNVFRMMIDASGNSRCVGNQIYGAVWNDYAEYRSASITTPGYVVREDKSGIMQLADDRLLPACEIISDTFGFAIGETDECKTPIATTGRVLAYPYEDRDSYELGDPVCSGPGGTVSKMSREEVRLYPERMLGYVSEIPSYKTWGSGNVEVNSRIWIRVK